jgi:hypothetical protein
LTSSSTMQASSSKETTRLLSLTRTPNSPTQDCRALLRVACFPRSRGSAEITRQQISRPIASG